MTQGIVVLVAKVDASDKGMGIATGAGSHTESSKAVTTAPDARLVGSSDAPGAVVVPKGFRADMPARGTFRPFAVAIHKILPYVVVLGFMFPRQGCIEAAFVL